MDEGPTEVWPTGAACVRILHISDIHRAPEAPTSNTALLGNLLDDIRFVYEKDNGRFRSGEPQLGPPDLIVVSGDLSQTAKHDEFEVAAQFLDGLLPLVGGDRSRVILVPGNHDVNWAIAAKSYTPATKDDYDAQLPRGQPYRQTVKRAPDGTYWRKNESSYTDRFGPFKTFFDAFYQGRYSYSLVRDEMFTVYDQSPSLGLIVVGFNSCDEIDAYLDEDNLSSLDRRAFLNTDAIYKAEQWSTLDDAQSGLMRIAVFHHNIRAVDHREDFLDPRYLAILKRTGFDLCLHGHVHSPVHDLFDARQDKVLPVVGAGSLAAPYPTRPPGTPMGYNLVVIQHQSRSIWVHTRRHDESNLIWEADYRWNGKPYCAVRGPSPVTAIPRALKPNMPVSRPDSREKQDLPLMGQDSVSRMEKHYASLLARKQEHLVQLELQIAEMIDPRNTHPDLVRNRDLLLEEIADLQKKLRALGKQS